MDNISTAAQNCDVLIIGGGPAGSTAAAFLATMGWNVVLLEKAHHPRFHIGESLLPMNLEIFKRLGVDEKVREIGIVKHGAEFNHQTDDTLQETFYFAKAMNKEAPKYAYQVRRSEFDHLLIRNAVDKGANVMEGIKVTAVDFHDDDSITVTAENERREQQQWQPRFLIDASGRDTFLAKKFGTKKKHPHHAAAAVFGHFDNVERRSGRNEGNISLYWFEHGWFWMIPLRDGQMSIGAVCYPEYLKTRSGDLETFLWDTLKLCPPLFSRMQNATLHNNKAHATGNYSYLTDGSHGKNHLMVGDAFAFVDPVFSSGVYIAMSGAERAALAIDKGLRHPEKMAAELDGFEAFVRRGIRTFSWFIYRFNSPVIRYLFMRPRNAFRIKEAIVSVLAGDVYGQTAIEKPLWLFKIIYYSTFAKLLIPSLGNYLRRQRNLRVNFSGGTTDQDAT